jgi:hypothetical protein
MDCNIAFPSEHTLDTFERDRRFVNGPRLLYMLDDVTSCHDGTRGRLTHNGKVVMHCVICSPASFSLPHFDQDMQALTSPMGTYVVGF